MIKGRSKRGSKRVIIVAKESKSIYVVIFEDGTLLAAS
jgi:uncharacterized protein YpmB